MTIDELREKYGIVIESDPIPDAETPIGPAGKDRSGDDTGAEKESCGGSEAEKEETSPAFSPLVSGPDGNNSDPNEVSETTAESHADSRVETPAEPLHSGDENNAGESGERPGIFGPDTQTARDGRPSSDPPEEEQSRGITSFLQRAGSFFRNPGEFTSNLPNLWQVDAVCILLTIVGVIAIVVNLPSVLTFIFTILYSIIEFVFGILFVICAVVGGIIALMMRPRGPRWWR